MLTNFRSYQLSLELYRMAKTVKLPHHLKDQLLRAASSVCLNLAEGSAKPTVKDRARFYAIALGSCREVQSLIEMERETLEALHPVSDRLALPPTRTPRTGTDIGYPNRKRIPPPTEKRKIPL